MLEEYDEALHYKNRCLRTRTGMLLFGPNGRRLSVDGLDAGPGFKGAMDFIHKMNIPELFTVRPDVPADFSQAEHIWYRTKMTMEYHTEDLDVWETKTVLEEDIALSVTEWTNCSDHDVTLRFDCAPDAYESREVWKPEESVSGYALMSPVTRFDFRLGVVSAWNQPEPTLTVAPGGTVHILAASAVGNMDQENFETLGKKVSDILTGERTPEQVMKAYLAEKRKFYDETPTFLCDDKRTCACWKYRWYILKNTLFAPGCGLFPGYVMYEGRDRRMAKTPFEPHGWEFNKMIPLSTPLQVTDFKWHQDHEVVKDVIRSAFAGQDEDGLLISTYINGPTRKSYANFMLWAIWNDYLVTPDPAFIKELMPRMKRYISGHEKVYMNEDDSLLIERTHSLTGKEYQPSYWYFTGYPQNPKKAKDQITPLKRVDRSIYHYLNLCGLAALMDAVGEAGSDLYREKAKKIAGEINEKMWDEKTGYYYDLHFETEEKAMVKNIVGIYPYWAGIAGKGREAGIEYLTNPDYFDTGSAFPSVAKDCEVFSPDGGWRGCFVKGRNGCVWDGPSWPYTTGIALDALGRMSTENDHRYDADFDRFFDQYTVQHFRDGDRYRPYLVEHYNPVSGERLSDEADYNHSYWINLVITYVAGLHLLPDAIRIDPLKTHLRWYRLENLKVRGHKVSILYSEDKDRADLGLKKGLTVLVDGREAAHSDKRSVLHIAL